MIALLVQALLELSDLESAEAMVQYYSERPPRLGSRTMIVRFSNYDELKTEPSPQVCLAMHMHISNYDELKTKPFPQVCLAMHIHISNNDELKTEPSPQVCLAMHINIFLIMMNSKLNHLQGVFGYTY